MHTTNLPLLPIAEYTCRGPWRAKHNNLKHNPMKALPFIVFLSIGLYLAAQNPGDLNARFGQNGILMESGEDTYHTGNGSAGNEGTFLVTNTNDSGEGSLRKAMADAVSNPGANTIVFDIPVSDPGYNSATGVWTIQPSTELPYLESDSTVIDGTTQTASQGDKNPQGPEIEINGSNLPEYGIVIIGSYNIIRGLTINRCASAGISIENHYNRISGNNIGTDASGTVRLPNGDGIVIYGAAKYNIIGGNTDADRNLISGNSYYGIKLIRYWDRQ